MKHYVPSKGDFVTVTFDQQSGHEQRGRRPALVVSNTLFSTNILVWQSFALLPTLIVISLSMYLLSTTLK